MLGLRPSHLLGLEERNNLKIYHLIIAYNDETEEIEYIQEQIEDDSGSTDAYILEVDEKYFDDEDLVELINKHGLGEA